jgi:hypothetical protein
MGNAQTGEPAAVTELSLDSRIDWQNTSAGKPDVGIADGQSSTG